MEDLYYLGQCYMFNEDKKKIKKLASFTTNLSFCDRAEEEYAEELKKLYK